MAQFNITLTEEELHGLFLNNNRDKAIEKLLEKIFNEVLKCQSAEQLLLDSQTRPDAIHPFS
jgi:putative transposase